MRVLILLFLLLTTLVFSKQYEIYDSCENTPAYRCIKVKKGKLWRSYIKTGHGQVTKSGFFKSPDIKYLFKSSSFYKYYPKLASLIKEINEGFTLLFYYKPCKDRYDMKLPDSYLKDFKLLKSKITKAIRITKRLKKDNPIFSKLLKRLYRLDKVSHIDKRLETYVKLKNREAKCEDITRNYISKDVYIMENYSYKVIETATLIGSKIEAKYKKAIQLNDLGYTYYKNKEYLNALNKWKEAIIENPKLAMAHYNLACVMNIIKDIKLKNIEESTLPVIKIEEIIKHLKISIKYKKDRFKRMQNDDDLKSLYNTDEYQKLLKNR